ncbi:MAG: TlyA family RNA methyltransferase [Elusimicrobia bacterium]|nr:TlyA family RNA methyltransferase [Elusimicrobiota bacterium]
MKKRADQILVERGLAQSRKTAQALILAGRVIRPLSPVPLKPGSLIPEDSPLDVSMAETYVSRGGEKLRAALEHFRISIAGKVCLDVGASTGGFTDCLLQHGAKKIYAVDVGHGQMHPKIRNCSQVRLFEKTNARYLKPSLFPIPPELAVIDVSFISLRKVLPAVTQCLCKPAELICLIKPQFEAEPKQIRKGVLRDEAIREKILRALEEFAPSLSLVSRGTIPSPLKGPKGNVEILWHLQLC